MEETVAVGRRKRAVASVRLRQGSGEIDVNGRSLENYFPLTLQRKMILEPFEVAGVEISSYNLLIRVHGGGLEGQAVAVRLGISRALVAQNNTLQAPFREKGFLTRDARRRERKKYGRAGARKRFQFSKR